MSKRRTVGATGHGKGWLLGAGALVLAALGVALWLLLDLDKGTTPPADGAVGALVPGAAPAAPQLPMVVPEGDASEPSRLEVEPGRPDRPAAAGRAVPRRRVSGRLLRFADGSPITDAQLSADGSEQVRTGGEDGAFALEVAEGDLDLQLTLGRRRAVVKLPAATGDLQGLELVVDTGWILPGVVRGVGGEPVPGATVEGPSSSTVCDAAGRFRLLDVRPSSVSPGVKIRARAPMYESRETSVPLPANQRVTPAVMIQLRGAGALEGWVKAPAGASLELGTKVRVAFSAVGRDVRPASRLLEADVEADGHYLIEGIPPGRHFVTVGAPGWRTGGRAPTRASDLVGRVESEPADDFGLPAYWVPDVDIREGEVTRLDLTPVPGAALSGRVTDASGNPLAGARVEAVREQAWAGVVGQGTRNTSSGSLALSVGESVPGQVVLASPMGTATSDAAGGYSLGELPPGRIVLRASHEEHPGWRPAERTLQLVSGVRSTGIDLRLGEGLRVLGQVFDALGQPAAGARVAVLEKDDPLTAAAKELGGHVMSMEDAIEVDEDGRFDLAGVPGGPLTLVVSHPGHQTVLRDVRPSLTPIRVDLEPAAVFLGRVMDARSGEPVASFHVLLRGHGMSMGNQLSPRDGRFRMDGLKQEDYRLEVKATGYRKAVLLDARPGFDQVEREILLVPVN